MSQINPGLEKIRAENAKMERESPYNFCDRWCERCPSPTQLRCSLYLNEVERKAICIAHGKDPEDSEIVREILEEQYAPSEEVAGDADLEESEINLDEMEGPEWEKIKAHIKFVENNSLDPTAEQYSRKTAQFLKETFSDKAGLTSEFVYHFETIAWYHTLLPAKIHRALCGFHEPMTEQELVLYDAIASFDVCQKAVRNSIAALQFIKPQYPQHKKLIVQLIALLHNISGQIKVLEENI